MIESKHITAITAVMLCISLILCGIIVYAANIVDVRNIPEYQNKLFGDVIVTIDIQVDKNEWQDLIDNAAEKEWIPGDLIINGERFSTVWIRAKGNSSITQVAKMDSDRYSLQFSLNHYVKGQTYYGLETFCVNNMTDDATYMKEYLSYGIMEYIGVETPLVNYAKVTVNGEDYGFLLLLERYDKAFLDRVYNTSAGQLYNVKSQNDGQGGSLLYTGNSTRRYSAIFDNAVFSNKSDKHEERVVAAIRNLNAGTDLDEYFDVDGVLRYFAAHTVVVNINSYISKQQQNYYIYERGGKLTILPWSYHLAFGGLISDMDNAAVIVNFPIDTPVMGVGMVERPLLHKLLEVDEYRERYHTYLNQIVEGYFLSGLFEDTIIALDTKIAQYVQNDVSAFYTYEQYKASLPALIELGYLRAESIKGQLEGAIPSTLSGQNADRSALIDVSRADISALGSGW